MKFRQPDSEDGKALWRLARDSGGLDLNSPYTYLMMAHYFAETCVVAEEGGDVAGFIVGFRPPEEPEGVFVWQVTTSPHYRGQGIGYRMLQALLSRLAERGVRYLLATVTPSNTASQKMFRGIARQLGVACEESELFAAETFPEGDHEAEHLYRIGPFTPGHVQNSLTGEKAIGGQTA